jgi:sorbitol-specific phosphotransferase system component IIA
MKAADICTEIAAEGMLALTFLSEAPAELGDVSVILPPQYKHYVFIAGLVATFILRVIRRIQTVNSIQAAAVAPIVPVPPVQPVKL